MTDPERPSPGRYDKRLLEVAASLAFSVSTRPMFGGTMVYADGVPIASLSSAGFAVKLLAPRYEEAMALPGAHQLRYAPDQPPRKQYVVLPDVVVDDDDALARWLNAAAAEKDR